jgi:hypothetical protein
MKLISIVCAAFLAAAIGSSAHATTYNYSYQFGSGDLLTGTLEGSLQGDANTINVSAASLPSIAGNLFPAASNMLISDDGITLGSAVVTLNGSLMNFGVVNTALGNGFNLHNDAGVPVSFAGFALPSGIASKLIYGELFNPGAWSIKAADVSTVPLPASLLMLLTGLGGLLVVRRKAA